VVPAKAILCCLLWTDHCCNSRLSVLFDCAVWTAFGDTNGTGVLLWLALSSIQPIGLLMAGYSSNNKYSLLGLAAAGAQSISYEIPLALSVLAVVMMSTA